MLGIFWIDITERCYSYQNQFNSLGTVVKLGMTTVVILLYNPLSVISNQNGCQA